MVAHEIGHGVGIRHHGEAVQAVVVQWVPEPDGWKGWWQAPADPKTGAQQENLERVTILDEVTGKPFEPGGLPPEGAKVLRQDRWMIWVLGQQSPASGVETCVMRYLDRGLYRSSRLERTFYVPDRAQWQARTRLCGGSEGTGVNAPDHRPESRYGPAALGDCKGQIVVNDLYQGQGR